LTHKYDAILIGSGSGKKVISSYLERYPRRKVAVVEKDKRGGICLNRGCRPSKMLIASADSVNFVESSSMFGISASVARKDFQKVMGRMRINQDRARGDLDANFFNREEIDFYHGIARFQGDNTISVNGEILVGDEFFLSTGSEPLIPPIEGISELSYLTSKDVLELDELPETLGIIGGGYIGAELGYFFSAMGTEVTIIGRNEQFIPGEEPEVSSVVARNLSEDINLLLGFEATVVKGTNENRVSLRATSTRRKTRTVVVDKLLVATGRKPINNLLNPEQAGIELTDRGWIKVDSNLRTSRENIWAMGDCTGRYLFKHVADYEAEIVSGNAVYGQEHDVDYSIIPHAVFTNPEVASVGISEDEAKAQYASEHITIGFARFRDTVKGQAIEENDGFVKILIDSERDEILGAHLVGSHSSILIQEIIFAMENGVSAEELAAGMHIHPSLSKVVKKACQSVYSLVDYDRLIKNEIE